MFGHSVLRFPLSSLKCEVLSCYRSPLNLKPTEGKEKGPQTERLTGGTPNPKPLPGDPKTYGF